MVREECSEAYTVLYVQLYIRILYCMHFIKLITIRIVHQYTMSQEGDLLMVAPTTTSSNWNELKGYV